MSKEQNIYEKLLQQGVPKQTLDNLLHKLAVNEKETRYNPKKITHKSVRGVLRALLNVLFARKPKNPV